MYYCKEHYNASWCSNYSSLKKQKFIADLSYELSESCINKKNTGPSHGHLPFMESQK